MLRRAGLHPAGQPSLDGIRHEAAVRAFEGHEAAAVVHQDLGELAESQGAVALRERTGGGETGGASGVRQELRVVHALHRSGEAHHEVVGRERDAGGDRLVVLEVVVVVLDEERWDAAQDRAVEIGDLGVAGADQLRLIGRADHGDRAVELAAHHFLCPIGSAHGQAAGGAAEAKVPVDVVAVGDDGVGALREAGEEHLAAMRERHPVLLAGVPGLHAVVAAGAGVDEEAEAADGVVWVGERPELPGIADRLAAVVVDLQFVRRGGFQAAGVEGPEGAGGVGPRAGEAGSAHAERRGLVERLGERCLEQDTIV